MEDKPNLDERLKTESFSITNPIINQVRSTASQLEETEGKKDKGCKFPSAYTILVIIEVIVFILTYIIPKGNFQKLEYSSNKDIFIITCPNETETTMNATQQVLDELKVRIPLESFKKGLIKKPISIPDTYEKIKSETTNFFYLFLFPVKGLIESADISFFLFILGGNLNILLEMKALSAGISALTRATKGKEFLLFILVFLIISIGGCLFGLMEEFLAFYPILIPVFLKSGFDGMLAFVCLYLPTTIGNLFSLLSPFSVVIGSYSAGISFLEGFLFRLICYIIGHIITFIYIFFYYKKIKLDPTSSIVYDIRKEIEAHFAKTERKSETEEEKDKNEEKKVNIEEKGEIIEEKEEIIEKKVEIMEKKEEKEEKEASEKEKFTLLQKIAIICFICGFGVMIFGVMALNWWFEHMTAVFAGFSIILMFILNKGEQKAIESFIKGAGDFIGVALIIGIARGINITLEEGKISDTILNSMTELISELPTVIFTIIMLILFILLGLLISSSSGLAILAMPVFAPLADKANCSRVVAVNAYMFGEFFSAIITPTGLVLIALQLVAIPYNYWIKFIWPFLVIYFFFLIVLIIINTLLYKE